MPQEKTKFSKGIVLDDRYEIQDPVGVDDYISVWMALDKQTQKTVAVKVLEYSPMDEEVVGEMKARFRREGRVCRLMRHEHITRVFSIGDFEGMTYFVMEWYNGNSLGETLKQKGFLQVERALDVAYKAARAMEYAHGLEVHHRDLNTRNILMRGDGTLKVTNFGFAKKLDDVTGSGILTRPGKILGTLEYLAPEYIERADVSHATDLYSLGVIIYEMLTGEPPIKGKTPMSFLQAQIAGKIVKPSQKNSTQKISKFLDEIVMKCLSKKPEDRYASASDLIQDMNLVLKHSDDSMEESMSNLAKQYYEQALEAFDRTDYWSCIQLCKAAIRVHPNRPELYIAMARAQAQIPKSRHKAVGTLHHAIMLDNTHEEAWLELAKVYANQGMRSLAVKKLKELLILNPTLQEASDILAKLEK